MYLTIAVLFEAELLRRFQDIFYQDSVLLKYWLVLLKFNFLTTQSISCTYTSIYKLTLALYGKIDTTQYVLYGGLYTCLIFRRKFENLEI